MKTYLVDLNTHYVLGKWNYQYKKHASEELFYFEIEHCRENQIFRSKPFTTQVEAQRKCTKFLSALKTLQ